MVKVFWDSEGISLTDFKDRNTMVNVHYYATMLIKITGLNKRKRRGKLTRRAVKWSSGITGHFAAIDKAAFIARGF